MMNIKQMFFFLSLLALYLSMVHGQTGQLLLLRIEKIEQKYAEEIKQYQNTLITLDAQMRKDSMTKKYKAIPVQRIIQLLESVSTYEKHIINESFFSIRKFLKKQRLMIRNIMDQEEILSQQVIFGLYRKTENYFEKIFDSYKAHKKAFSSRGLMYYSGIKKIKEIKKTLLTQAFNEEKLGFTGIIEKIHYHYLYKPTHYMMKNPHYILLPFLAFGAYKLMYPPQEAKGNLMLDTRKNHQNGGKKYFSQKPKKIHDLGLLEIEPLLVKGCLSQIRDGFPGANCGPYAAFHAFTLLLNKEEQDAMFQEIKQALALNENKDEREQALSIVLDHSKDLRERFNAFMNHYLWWAMLEVKKEFTNEKNEKELIFISKVQEDINVQKKAIEKERKKIEELNNEKKCINQSVDTLRAETWFEMLFGKEEPEEIRKINSQIATINQTISDHENQIREIERQDLNGNYVRSDTLEAFITYFFDIPVEKEDRKYHLARKDKDNCGHLVFGNGNLFLIEFRGNEGNTFFKALANSIQTIQDQEMYIDMKLYAQCIQTFFDPENLNPNPLYVLITNGGHFTSAKFEKKDGIFSIQRTNSLIGNSDGDAKKIFDAMKAVYENGKIDTIIDLAEQHEKALSFEENIWGSLAAAIKNFQILDDLKEEMQNFKGQSIKYYEKEIKEAHFEAQKQKYLDQKTKIESDLPISYDAISHTHVLQVNDITSIKENVISYIKNVGTNVISNKNDIKKIQEKIAEFKESLMKKTKLLLKQEKNTYQSFILEKKNGSLLITLENKEIAEPSMMIIVLAYKALLIDVYNQIN